MRHANLVRNEIIRVFFIFSLLALFIHLTLFSIYYYTKSSYQPWFLSSISTYIAFITVLTKEILLPKLKECLFFKMQKKEKIY